MDDNSIISFWFSLFAELLPVVMHSFSYANRNPNFNSDIPSTALPILQSKVAYIENFS